MNKKIIIYLLLILILILFFLIYIDKKEFFINNQVTIYSKKLTIKNIENIKKGQKIMSNMLKYVDTLCVNNNIKYWCLGGTLIGVLRHKGWVPWDADIDIGMLEEDYKKFKSIVKQLPHNIEFSEPRNKPCIKLRSTEAKYIYADWAQKDDINKGLQIDIFLYKKNNGIIFPHQNNYLGHICGVPDKKKRFFNDIFPLKRKHFDDFLVYIPNKNKKISKELWGGYPPKMIPIEKRLPHEGNIEIIEKFESNNSNDKYFKDILSIEEKKKLNTLLKVLLNHLKKRKIKYFFSFGSLIGIVRHGFRMPWDDDIDILISNEEVTKLVEGLKIIESNNDGIRYKLNNEIHILKKTWGCPIKIYLNNSSYPFIDIFVYKFKDNDVIVPEQQLKGGHVSHFKEKYNDIFPLKKAKFENFIVNIPRNYKVILNNLYGDNVLEECVITYNHKMTNEQKNNFNNKIINISDVNKKYIKPFIY